VSAPGSQASGQQENPRVKLFGPRLKEHREKRGITLEQISQSTKIGTRFLQALEDDHFERLPGGIFNKGFVRAYARCIGVDEDQAVADYLAATGASQPTPETVHEAPVIAPPPEPPSNPAATGLPWGVFATLLLVIAFSFAVWGFYSRVTNPREKEPAPTPQAPVSTAPAEEPSASKPTSPQPSSPQPTNSQPAKKVQPPAMPTVQGNSAPSVPAPNSSAPGAPASNASGATSPTRDLVLHIRAREDSWLSVTVDGEVTTQQILAASGEKTVRGQNAIVIRAGNIGALDFEFKGKQLPQQGEIGEVKTLIFDASGWHAAHQRLSTPEPEPQP
jgi:cytoskeleton protein RodZ